MQQTLGIPEFYTVEEWAKRENRPLRRAWVEVLRHEIELLDGSMRIDGVLYHHREVTDAWRQKRKS